MPSLKYKLQRLLHNEWAHLSKVNVSDRPWHLPFIVAIATSSPVFIGVYYHNVGMGIIASLGAMIILNLPETGTVSSRLTHLMACGFGMIFAFSLGLMVRLLPILLLPTFFCMAFTIVMAGRYYQMTPPAGLFILTAGTIAMFINVPLSEVPNLIGVVALGSILAWLVAMVYILIVAVSTSKQPIPNTNYTTGLLEDVFIIALFLTLSLAIAHGLNLTNPYWVAVSCFIIIQGMGLRTIWIKQLHRLIGTGVGVFVSWGLLSLSLPPWGIALTMFVLMFNIETWIVRHYGLAVAFITPLTIFLAEYGIGVSSDAAASATVVTARFWDIVLGCCIGMFGGIVIHSPKLRQLLFKDYSQRIEARFIQKMRS